MAWPIVVLVALIGWGCAGAWVARAVAGVELRTLGATLAVGMALVLAVAGAAIALGVLNGPVMYVGIGAGIALALGELVRRVHVSGGIATWFELPNVAVGFVLVIAALGIALWATAHFTWNPCDDDAAYLYLAKRLVLEGNLLDPTNNRRLTSLGGMSALQALFLVRLPDSFLPLPDLFLGPVLVLFGVWRSHLRRWAFWGVSSTFLLLLFPSNLGPSNSSPILIPIGLSIGAFSVAFEMRAAAATPLARLVQACLLGLIVGAATALRPQFAISGVVAFVMAVWPPWDLGVVQRLAGLGIGLVVALGGWMVASWRAVGTPLFPILSGNLDPSWPSDGPAPGAVPVTEFFGRLVPSLANPPWGFALIFSFGVLAIVVAQTQSAETERHWALRLQVAAGVASAALVTILLRIYWTSGSPLTYARFWAPIVVAAILMPVVLVNRIAPEYSKTVGLAGLAIFIMVAISLTADPRAGFDETRLIAQDTITRHVFTDLNADRYASVRGDYAQAAELIRPGSKVLAAVDVPSLLISSSYELNTLDIPGSTSPSPHLPYFSGTAAKLGWLRDHGYTYIIAVDPSASVCLYSGPLAAADIQGENGRIYQSWAPFSLDWFNFLTDLADPSVATLTRIGHLMVVKL